MALLQPDRSSPSPKGKGLSNHGPLGVAYRQLPHNRLLH